MTAPLIATSTLSALPSQAATLAYSFGELKLTNFSTNFATIESDNFADTSASANGGIGNVSNQAVIETDAPEVTAYAISEASGENKDYFALAQTQGTIVGNFYIDAGNIFSFDFQSFLDIERIIDEPSFENASAFADVSFSVYDTSDIAQNRLPDFLADLLAEPTNIQKNPLAFFSLAGDLNSLGIGDSLRSEKSGNVTISAEQNDSRFGGNEEYASAFLTGSFQQRFDNQANLTLVALRNTEARAIAPEPANTLALLAIPGLIGVASKGRRKTTTSVGRSFDRKVMRLTVGK